MKSLEQKIKDNKRFFQKEVEKRLDSVMNPILSSFDLDVSRNCIFCSQHKVNDLIFDIVAKFYEVDSEKTAFRTERRRICTHGRWIFASTTELAYHIQNSFTYGFADIWALCGDMKMMPDFKPKDAIAILSDFDLMELVLDRDINYPGRVEEYFFYSTYERLVQQGKSKRGEIITEPCERNQVDLDEIDDITRQQFEWKVKNKEVIIPREIEKEIMQKHGKNLLEKFEMTDIEHLIRLRTEYANIFPMKDLTIRMLKKVGKEWIQSLDPERYNPGGFSETQKRLEYNKSLMTYPHEPKSRWAYEKEELLTWKEDTEKELGRKIVFNIWQK